jgi:hypothetical protein
MNGTISIARTSARGSFNLFWGLVASNLISALGVILVARLLLLICVSFDLGRL